MADIKEIIRKELAGDPLFKFLTEQGLENSLLNEGNGVSLSTQASYSIIEATKFVGMGVKEYTIRNYLKRYNFDTYVNLYTVGSQKMMDYLGVIRLRMIFMVNHEFNKGPQSIAEMLGLLASSGSNTFNSNNGYQSTALNEMDVGTRETSSNMMSQLIAFTSLNQRKELLIEKKERIHREIVSLGRNLEHYRYSWEQQEKNISDQERMFLKLKQNEEELRKQEKAAIDTFENVGNQFSLKGFFKRITRDFGSQYHEVLQRNSKGAENVLDKDEKKRIEIQKEKLKVEREEKEEEIRSDVNQMKDKLEEVEQEIVSLDNQISRLDIESEQIMQLMDPTNNKEDK